MTFNPFAHGIVLKPMEIKSTLLGVLEYSKSFKYSQLVIIYLKNFRYTEIWSNDGESKSIKLADPQLDNYYEYPELFLVDIDYCVKP